MNCATTILLNPEALAPSASIPFIPHTERREMLKMYGEAPETVSVSTTTNALAALGDAGRVLRNVGSKNVNCVGLRTF